MFCPACGTESNEQLKYCTRCGVNLRRVKGVLGKGGGGMSERSDSMNAEHNAGVEDWRESQKAKRKRSPEEKRYEEIKAGVITCSVGFGLFIFLSVFFDAIASTAPADKAAILRAIPFAGMIPILIGAGIIFNGVIISRKIVELKRREADSLEPSRRPSLVANTTQVPRLEMMNQPIAEYSVAEPTTKSLKEPASLVSSQEPRA
jgi:hypothetical protein